MRKKYLFPAIIIVFLTSCGQSGDGIQEIHINAEDIIYNTAEENAAFSEEDDTISEESPTDAEGFDNAGYFQEYSALAAPASISGIEFLGKNHDRYLFSFPDNEDTAKKQRIRHAAPVKRIYAGGIRGKLHYKR